MILKIFTKPGCPACPPAKALGEKIKTKVKVELHDVSKPKGLGEAAKYGVMSTPTLILIDDRGRIKKTWLGTPEEKQVEKEL